MAARAAGWSTGAMSDLPLAGRTVLITGVSRRAGIGYAVARRVAALGAHVACHHFGAHDAEQPWGADDQDAVLVGVRERLTPGAELAERGGDLTVEGEPERLLAWATERFGRVDALVCNQALSGSDGALGALDAAMLDRHWAVDARASILLAQAFAARHEAERSGSLVFLTSGQGQGPMPGEVAYAAAKAALAGVTLTLADQLADTGIRVNTVNPGPVDTGYLTPEAWAQVAPMFPFGRFGEPEDPARLIAWLLTEDAAWITGQVLNTEGGFARWRPRGG